MHFRSAAIVFALFALVYRDAEAQRSPSSAEAHMAAAKQAAGMDITGLLAQLCVTPDIFIGGGGGTPDRATWFAEPVKVFDNLIFVGTKTHASWALTTSAGIILIDTAFNYAAEEEIVGGLKKMGLDPAQVKYVLISHGHGDRAEGAKMMQDRFGARIVISAEDWAMIEKLDKMPGGKPKRDIVAMDGQKITLGDTTVTLVATPGHTAGAMSFLFTVKDNGKPLTVVYQGGMALPGSGAAALNAYVSSQHKLAGLAAQANATVVMTTHTMGDNMQTKMHLLPNRKAGEANPFDVGKDGVARYFTVGSECAEAALARLKPPGA